MCDGVVGAPSNSLRRGRIALPSRHREEQFSALDVTGWFAPRAADRFKQGALVLGQGA
jgi:hypothetical protein